MTDRSSIIVVDRESNNVLQIDELSPEMLTLDPSKPLIYALFHNSPTKINRSSSGLWTIKCFSSTQGRTIWSTQVEILL